MRSRYTEKSASLGALRKTHYEDLLVWPGSINMVFKGCFNNNSLILLGPGTAERKETRYSLREQTCKHDRLSNFTHRKSGYLGHRKNHKNVAFICVYLPSVAGIASSDMCSVCRAHVPRAVGSKMWNPIRVRGMRT